MKIKQQILEQVNTPAIRSEIAVALNQGEPSIYRAMIQNHSHGILTKYAALRVISEKVGAPIEEILEPANELVKA